MQANAETWLEGFADHPLSVDFEDPRCCKPSHKRLTDDGGIGSSPGSEPQRFRYRLDVQGNDDLIRDLGDLTVADAPDQRDVLAHLLK